MISAMSKQHPKAIADELDEILSAGWIAAGIPPTALENPIFKKASSWSHGRHAPHMCTPQSLAARTHTPAVRAISLRLMSAACPCHCPCQPRSSSALRSVCGGCSHGFRARSAIVLSKREPAGWRTCTGHCATRPAEDDSEEHARLRS